MSPVPPLTSGDFAQLRRNDGAFGPDAFQVVEVRPGRVKLRFGDHDEWRSIGETARIEDDTPHRAQALLDEIDDCLDYARRQNIGSLYPELLPDGRLIVTDADGGQWLIAATPYEADPT